MAEGSPGELIGRNVRAVREAKLFSRTELAERSGVSLAGIDHLERGLSARPRRRTVERLAKALGVDVEALMEGTETPKAEAPPSQEKLFNNGILEEERRAYDVPEWLTPDYRAAREALDRYCDAWEQRLEGGDLDLDMIDRFFEDFEHWDFILSAAVWAEFVDLVRSGRVRVDPDTDDPTDELDKLYGAAELGQAGLRHLDLFDKLLEAAKALRIDAEVLAHMERQAEERRARFTVVPGELSA